MKRRPFTQQNVFTYVHAEGKLDPAGHNKVGLLCSPCAVALAYIYDLIALIVLAPMNRPKDKGE